STVMAARISRTTAKEATTRAPVVKRVVFMMVATFICLQKPMTQDAAWKLFEILDKVDDGGVTPGPILLVDYRSPSYEHCRSYPTPARPYRRSLLMANGLIM